MLYRAFGLSLLLGAFICLTACVEPRPNKVIFMLDSSKSSQEHRNEAIQTVKQIAKRLDSHVDSVVIYKLGEDVYSIYSGSPKQPKFIEIMDAYAVSKPNEYGTAYGAALKRGLKEIHVDAERKPAEGKQAPRHTLLFLGDGADETVKSGQNITDEDMKQLINQFPKDGYLGFMYIKPENGDRFRELLYPVLGDERLQIITPVEAKDNKRVLNNLYKHLER